MGRGPTPLSTPSGRAPLPIREPRPSPPSPCAQALFNIAAAAGGTGSFQVGGAAGAGRFAVLSLAAMHFSAPDAGGAGGVLFHSFDAGKVRAAQSVQRAVLDCEAYGRVRGEVKAKLGSRAADLVEGVALP